MYTDKAEKEPTKGVDKDFGFHINRPFYIRSRLPMQRVVECISASNATIKKYVKNRKAQQWIFDGVSKTISNINWKNYSLDKQGNNLAVRTTTSRWN